MDDYKSENVDQEIIKLWDRGFSGTQIARVVGLTRNSVMGRVFRMRKAGIIVGSRTIYRGDMSGRKRAIEAAKDPAERESDIGIGFWRLKNDTCKYALNDGPFPHYVFCGLPTHTRSYCKEHHDLCYVPPQPRRKRTTNFITQSLNLYS